MKKILLMLAMIVFGTTIAQEKKPTEVKEETEIHTVKVKTDKGTTEKKTKVVTKESASVELDKKDKNKVNQDQVESTKKVEKAVFVDNDNDNEDDYKFLTKETYYVSGDENYVFTPNNRGFDITFNKNNDHLIKIGKAWNSSTDGYYILNGQMHNGIGYFDSNGNFTVEYYNKDTDQIETKTYKLVIVE